MPFDSLFSGGNSEAKMLPLYVLEKMANIFKNITTETGYYGKAISILYF